MTGALAVLALFLLARAVTGMHHDNDSSDREIFVFGVLAMAAGYGAWVLR